MFLRNSIFCMHAPRTFLPFYRSKTTFRKDEKNVFWFRFVKKTRAYTSIIKKKVYICIVLM